MKYSTPGVSRQRSHKSNSTYIIKLWTSPLNHSTDKSHNTILNEASVGRRIIFSISHKWRRMSTFSILVIYDNLFWWKTIRNPDASSHLLFFLILNSFWQSDLRRTIWSPYHSGDRCAHMWKGQIDFVSIFSSLITVIYWHWIFCTQDEISMNFDYKIGLQRQVSE